MDDRRFDTLIRALGSGTSRRTVIRGLIGLGASAATASVASERAQGARRGFSGPKFPTPPPCAQIGDSCGAGCCSGNCCSGTCLTAGACCSDTDCPAEGECTIAVCNADHACETAPDPACEPDCSSCGFSDFCACLPLCMGGPPIENIICIEELCGPHLDGCPVECATENPCAGGV